MSAHTENLWNIVLSFVAQKANAISQMDKYKKVIDKVEAQLRKMEDLAGVEETLTNDHQKMNLNPDSAKGKLAIVFHEKEAIHNAATQTLCTELEEAIATVRKQLAQAQEQYNYWKDELLSGTRGEEEARQKHNQAVEAERREEERRRREEEQRRREEEQRRRKEEEAEKQKNKRKKGA